MERNNVPSIWWAWLVVAAVLTMLYSLSFVLLPDISLSSTSGVYLGSPDAYQAFGDDGAAYLRFILGVSGAISVAWMVIILFVVLVPFRRGERWAWQAVAASLLIWFVFDSAHSIASGFAANAIYNLLVLILFAIPLGASYSYFQRR